MKLRIFESLHFTNERCKGWSWPSIRLELQKIERFLVAMQKKISIRGAFAGLLVISRKTNVKLYEIANIDLL